MRPLKHFYYLCATKLQIIIMGNHQKTFSDRFHCDDDCYRYLATIKWQGESFICQRCGNTSYHRGRTPYSRRCCRCKHDESVTAGTMFHKLKFPILTAFQIIFRLATMNKGNSSNELAMMFGIQQRTCLLFRYKVQEAMKRIARQQLTHTVGLDIFNLVDWDSRYLYREYIMSRRKLPEHYVGVAIDMRGGKILKGYATTLGRYIGDDLLDFLKPIVPRNTVILTYLSYRIRSLKSKFKNLDFVKDVPLLEQHSQELRHWLLSESRRYSEKHLQGYLDEYYFRFNQRHNSSRNFYILIEEMMKP